MTKAGLAAPWFLRSSHLPACHACDRARALRFSNDGRLLELGQWRQVLDGPARRWHVVSEEIRRYGISDTHRFLSRRVAPRGSNAAKPGRAVMGSARRRSPKRVAVGNIDRLLFVGLYRFSPKCATRSNPQARDGPVLASRGVLGVLELEITIVQRIQNAGQPAHRVRRTAICRSRKG